MDKFYHSVRLGPALCKGCTNCIKRYPMQAICVRDGKVQINGKSCASRGECIHVCPHHVKHTTYDKLDAMKQYEYTVALPVPSLHGQLNNLDDVSIVLNDLLLMGPDDVFEVGAATGVVSEATRSHPTEYEGQLPVISTTCSPVIRPIRVRFPNLIPHLLPPDPLAEVAACMAVEQAMKETGLAREKIDIIFISPCPSKMTYMKSSLGTGKSEVDHMLVTEKVCPQPLSYMKVVGEDGLEISTSRKIGVSWGRNGDEANSLFTENHLTADGIENVVRMPEDLEDQKLSNLKLVESNAYSGGYVDSVLTVESLYVAEVKLKRLRKYVPVARSHVETDAVDCVPWTTGVQSEPVPRLGDSTIESFSRLERVERLCKKLPGLDCDSYGALTRKTLAEDIVRGEASEEDCVYFLRDNLRSLSQKVAMLADDLADRDKGDAETLNVLKEYIQRISGEMTTLDNKVREK